MKAKIIFRNLPSILFLSFLTNFLAYSQGNQEQATGKRIALVIGAQSYTVLPPLRNSLNDAKAMATALQAKGFQVDAIYNPKTKKDIKDAIARYYNLMKDQVDGVGIIFYAGHGMQLDGNNYLIPTMASLQIPDDLDDQCVKMNAVMSALKASSNSLNILLLDACRTLPSFSRDSEQGWSKVDAPRGSIVVFATEAGKVASDGTGKNGLFTAKLLNVINEPGLNITEVFKRVKRDVYTESNAKQLPSVEDNSIGGDFYFTPSANTPQVNTQQTATQTQAKVEPKKNEVKREVISNGSNSDYGYGPENTQLVTVGKQAWINKNLNTDRFANGEEIPEVKTLEEWKTAGENKQPAWSNYDLSEATGTTYGKLYNWFAVVDPRGLCPAGSHVPSEKEWTALTNSAGKGPANQLKSASWYADGKDAYKFSARPGGLRLSNGKFSALGEEGYWWSSTEGSSSYGVGCFIGSVSDAITKRSYRKENGFSVRCVKD